MITVINSTESLRNSVTNAIHTLENLIHEEANIVTTDVENDVKADVAKVEADVSPILHSITATPLAVGTDITIRLHHAQGEVRRIVLNGTTTVESFIAQLRSLV